MRRPGVHTVGRHRAVVCELRRNCFQLRTDAVRVENHGGAAPAHSVEQDLGRGGQAEGAQLGLRDAASLSRLAL